MANILEQVQTYQRSNLALLQNLNCFVSTANTKFKNFDKITANLGDTVTFDLPPRLTSSPSLVAVFQDVEQRKMALTVDQAANTSYQFTAQEEIFNVEGYMDQFGRSAQATLSTQVEANLAKNCVSNTYRFFGDGVTAIDSFTLLARMLANFRNYGAAPHNTKAYLWDLAIPEIVGTGLTQFVPKRNDEMANSWDIGDFGNASFYTSNLLPVHIAGTVGQANQTLTLISVSADGTQLTFSGASANDPDAIKEGDLFSFTHGVPGQTDLYYLTYVGYQTSGQDVQCAATADAASNGTGNVTISVNPPLISTEGDPNRNLNAPLNAGMEITVLPSHRAGMVCSGDAFYIAMPKLPSEDPFPTANEYDPETGVSMRMYYGSKFGMNQRGMVHDNIWGSKLVPEYAMRIVFPL